MNAGEPCPECEHVDGGDTCECAYCEADSTEIVIDETATYSAAINAVAKHLPEGWQIRITLERDAGDVQLFDPDGDEVFFASNREHCTETLNDALNCAIEDGKNKN